MRLAVWSVAAIFAIPLDAAANGAFPDSMSVFAFEGRPEHLILATNFGLLVSDDGGQNFDWICEEAIARFAGLYQHGPTLEHPLYAVTVDGLGVSRDRGCTWATTAGTSTVSVADVFGDPSDPLRAVVVVRARTSTLGDALYLSGDGGATLGRKLIHFRRGIFLESVEIAKSDPQTIYFTTTSTGAEKHPTLYRTRDAGEHLDEIPLLPLIGDRRPLIAAVDPEDARIVYFRVRRNTDQEGDRLAIATQGGDAVDVALELPAVMTGFLRRSDGAVIVASLEGSFIAPSARETFAPWPNAPKLRALAEANGAIYGAADNFADGYALGVTRDHGATWTPLLRFDQIRGPKACGDVEEICKFPWRDLKMLFGIGVQPMPEPTENGSEACDCTAAREGAPSWLLLAMLSARVLRRRSTSRGTPRR